MYAAASTSNPLGNRATALHGLGSDGISVSVANAEVPPGTIVKYVGVWGNTWTLRSDEVFQKVAQRLALDGLPVRSHSIDKPWFGDVVTSSFEVTMQVQVLGGFSKIDDLISIIRHEVYEVTGSFPLSDSVPVIGTQSTGQPSNPDPNAVDLSQWFMDNAGIIGVGAAAILLGMILVKKL